MNEWIHLECSRIANTQHYVMLEHMTESANNALYSMIGGVEIPVHHALYWIGQECGHTLSKDQTQGVECSMMSGVWKHGRNSASFSAPTSDDV